MIGYLRGTVSHMFLGSCFIDVQGVGYRVYISQGTGSQLKEGDRAMLFTYMNVREDAIQLFGFLTQAEQELFLLLISVSGIGPKVGMGMLSAMSPEAIRTAIATDNIPGLVKLPGIGKKSAERLVLELKDKIGQVALPQLHVDARGAKELIQTPMGAGQEVLEALTGLGYTENEVLPLIESLSETYTEVPQLLKAVLGEIGKKR